MNCIVANLFSYNTIHLQCPDYKEKTKSHPGRKEGGMWWWCPIEGFHCTIRIFDSTHTQFVNILSSSERALHAGTVFKQNGVSLLPVYDTR